MKKNRFYNLKFFETMKNKKKRNRNQKSQEIHLKKNKKFLINDPNCSVETYFKLRNWIKGSLVFYKSQFKKLLIPFAIHCFVNLLKKGFFVEAKIFLLRIKIDLVGKLFDFDKNFINIIFFKKSNIEEIIEVFEKKRYKVKLTISTFDLLLNYSEAKLSWCFLKFLNEKVKIVLKKKKNKKFIRKKFVINLKKSKKKIFIKKKESTFCLFKKNTPKIVKIFKLVSKEKHLVNSFDFSKNENTIITGWQNSIVNVYDQIKENETKKNFSLIGHTRPIYSAKLSRCDNFVLSGTSNGELNLWSLRFGKLLVKYQNMIEPIWDISFSGWNPFFLTSGGKNLALLWASNSLYPVRLFSGHTSDVNVVRWHPSNMLIGTGSSDGISRLWDIRRAKSIATFEEVGFPIHSLEFSPDGFEISLSGLREKIFIWDIRTNKFKESLNDLSYNKIVKSLSYSPNSKKFAFTSNQNFVKIWNKIQKKNTIKRKMFLQHKIFDDLIKIKIGKIFNLNIRSEDRISITGIA